MAVLRRAAHVLGEPIYIFGDDVTEAWLRVPSAIAVKAEESIFSMIVSPAAFSRIRAMSIAARVARGVTLASRATERLSVSDPSTTLLGAAAAASKKASVSGH